MISDHRPFMLAMAGDSLPELPTLDANGGFAIGAWHIEQGITGAKLFNAVVL